VLEKDIRINLGSLYIAPAYGDIDSLFPLAPVQLDHVDIAFSKARSA
jgi:hypothetical protein